MNSYTSKFRRLGKCITNSDLIRKSMIMES